MGYMGVGRGIQGRREGCAEGKGAPGSGRASFQLFLTGPKFFLFFIVTGLLKNWKKQHFICSNLTLLIVPFFLFSYFFLFFSLFFSFFFLFSFSLGGRRHPQPPSNDTPGIWVRRGADRESKEVQNYCFME